MAPSELPPELAELESELLGRAHPPLPPELRGRVLTTLRQHSAGKHSWTTFAAGLAAAALLCLNLTLTAVNQTDFLGRALPDPAATAALAQQIQDVVPELSEREARGRALLYGSGRFSAPALPGIVSLSMPSDY